MCMKGTMLCGCLLLLGCACCIGVGKIDLRHDQMFILRRPYFPIQENNGGADEVTLANAFFGLVEHLAMVMAADREFILETVSEAARLPSNFLCAPRNFRVDLVIAPTAIEGLARLLFVHADNAKNHAKFKSQASNSIAFCKEMLILMGHFSVQLSVRFLSDASYTDSNNSLSIL